MSDSRPIYLVLSPPVFGGAEWHGYRWRAYGVTKETGSRFMLPETLGGVTYPFERPTMKALRRAAEKLYPGHPFVVEE